MKRLLAFAASSTIAALLLMRILPELAADPEKTAEPREPNVPSELSTPDTPRPETPETAVALMLPPPPAPQLEAASVTTAPEIEPITESVPAVTAPVKAAPAPKPRPISEPAKVETQMAAAPPTRLESRFVTPGPTVEAEGRVLLRILEHGSGPVVEIAWPVSATQRRALYRLFEACYGMEIAVIDSGGRLFGRTGESGQPWQPNLDRYSGFVRQPSGRLTLDEKDSIARIRSYHGGLLAADNVRLFPRRLDALLLGGLKALIGKGYAEATAIRAHYRRDGDSVLVEGVRLDGRPILGRIDLSKAGRHCRPGAWS